MTDQEIFNIVALHLFKQQAGSFDEDREHCLYRNDDGLKCAIGILIPDDKYDSKMEGNLSKNKFPISVQKLLKLDFMESYKDSKKLLIDLQNAHDTSTIYHDNFWEDCKIRLINIAEKFNLVVPSEIL